MEEFYNFVLSLTTVRRLQSSLFLVLSLSMEREAATSEVRERETSSEAMLICIITEHSWEGVEKDDCS